MPVVIASDLHLELSGHRMRLRGEGSRLVAEFDSLTSLRSMRRSLPALGNRLPAVLRLPGLDAVHIRVQVRGRTVAEVDTTDHSATVRPRWLSLLATVLHLPSRR